MLWEPFHHNTFWPIRNTEIVDAFTEIEIQSCMSFTEKIVVGLISGKVMHSGKVMYMAFTESFFKVMHCTQIGFDEVLL